MSKTRITDVAGEFDTPKETVLKLLKDAGFEVRSVLSPIESEWVDKIRPALEGERDKSGKKPKKVAARGGAAASAGVHRRGTDGRRFRAAARARSRIPALLPEGRHP